MTALDRLHPTHVGVGRSAAMDMTLRPPWSSFLSVFVRSTRATSSAQDSESSKEMWGRCRTHENRGLGGAAGSPSCCRLVTLPVPSTPSRRPRGSRDPAKQPDLPTTISFDDLSPLSLFCWQKLFQARRIVRDDTRSPRPPALHPPGLVLPTPTRSRSTGGLTFVCPVDGWPRPQPPSRSRSRPLPICTTRGPDAQPHRPCRSCFTHPSLAHSILARFLLGRSAQPVDLPRRSGVRQQLQARRTGRHANPALQDARLPLCCDPKTVGPLVDLRLQSTSRHSPLPLSPALSDGLSRRRPTERIH